MEGVEEVPEERRPETAEKLQLLDGTGINSTFDQDDARACICILQTEASYVRMYIHI